MLPLVAPLAVASLVAVPGLAVLVVALERCTVLLAMVLSVSVAIAVSRPVRGLAVGLTPTPTPTPSQVPPTTTATLTPTPTPTQVPPTATDLLGISTSWPTIKDGLEADYRLFVAAWWNKHCRPCYHPLRETYLGYFNQYIATYVASECVAGGKLTTKGFMDFLDETFGLVKLGIRARDTLQNMNGLAEGRIKAGLTPVTDDCQRLILYPESGLEVALAGGLYSAGRLLSIPSFLRDETLENMEDSFGGWLLVEDNQQRTIFRWYCKQGCEGLLP